MKKEHKESNIQGVKKSPEPPAVGVPETRTPPSAQNSVADAEEAWYETG
jgi:hypothetical protein